MAASVLTLDEELLPLTGAVGGPTRTPRLGYYMQRDKFGLSAAEVGGGMGGAYAAANQATAGPPATYVITTASAYYATPPTADSVLAKHDHVTLTEPRHVGVLETYLEWWSGAPGFAHSMTFVGADGSFMIEVADIGMLTVGQAISGAGITSPTIITGMHIDPTVAGVRGKHYAHLSQALTVAATAGTDTIATLTGSNLILSLPISRFKSLQPADPTVME